MGPVQPSATAGRRVLRALAVAALFLPLGAGAAVAPLRPTPLAVGAAEQSNPFASGAWIAWTSRGTGGDGAPYAAAFVSTAGGEPRRIVPEDAIVVGLTGNVLWYVRAGAVGATGLERYDLVTGKSGHLEPGLSFKALGARVRLPWILYVVSARCGSTTLRLHNVATGSDRTLDHFACVPGTLRPGALTSTQALWTKCIDVERCEVYRRDLASGRTVRAPNPGRWSQFAPSVATDGSVYFARRRTAGCGGGRSLARWKPTARTLEIVGALPGRSDVVATATRADGRHALIAFEARPCDSLDSDIFTVHA